MLLWGETPMVRDGEAVLVTGLGVVRRPSRTYPVGRICAAPECDTRLSIYNPEVRCWVHEAAEADDVPKADRAA
jgi:hypothetical protein